MVMQAGRNGAESSISERAGSQKRLRHTSSNEATPTPTLACGGHFYSNYQVCFGVCIFVHMPCAHVE